jgi:hypothetical protein
MLYLKPRSAVSVFQSEHALQFIQIVLAFGAMAWLVAGGAQRAPCCCPTYCQIHKAISRYSVSLRLLGAGADTPASKKESIEQHHIQRRPVSGRMH